MTSASTTSLAGIPQVLLKSLEACDSEAADLRQRAIVCLLDAGLSLAVLKAAGLTRGRRGANVSVEEAVRRLGAAALRQLVLSMLVKQCAGPLEKGQYAHLVSHWRHSAKCAFIARRLAQASGIVPAGEAYLAGLVHDIGKRVALSSMDRGAREQRQGDQSAEEKKAVSRRRHPGIGALMVEQATGSTLLADAVRYHHESDERVRGAFGLVKVVYVANKLSHARDGALEPLVRLAEELCGISGGVLKKITARADEDFSRALRFLGLPPPPKNGLAASLYADGNENRQRCCSEIGDRSLLSAGLQSLMYTSPQAEAFLRALADGLKINFSIRRLMFFMPDEDGERLQPVAIRECPRLPQGQNIAVGKPVTGIVARSFAEGRVTDSFGFHARCESTIADEQILHLLGSEGFCCAPLLASGRCLGVVVMGGGPEVVRELRTRAGLLKKLTASTGHFLLEGPPGIGRRREPEGAERTLVPRRMVHEVNNPLGIIKNYLRLLSLKLPEGHSGRGELKLVLEEIDRIAQILKKYTTLSEPEIQPKKPIDLNRQLEAFLKILEKTLLRPRRIILHMDLDPSLPLFSTDWNALKQIVLNLVHNAAEAMPQGGRLRVCTRRVPLPTGPGTRRPSAAGLEIAVSDTGRGIDPQLHKRLFEPYVTSKGAGHSGLGLYVVHSLVKALGGKLDFSSRPQKGTVFKIVFPL